MTEGFKNTLIWLLAGTIGVAMAMTAVSASYIDGVFLPVGNDSFYHARRILETVGDPASFFEFDPHIHVPEGSWVTWPWFYDYFMAQQVRLMMALSGTSNPVPILMYLPVAWIFVNIGLVLVICSLLGFRWLFKLLACLFVALSPLLQMLHGVGTIDHHFMELSGILAVLLTGLWWFRDCTSIAKALLLGMTLGITQGVHNAHFILLVPVFLSLVVLWMRGQIFHLRPLVSLSGGYFFVTCALLMGSEPFHNGFFEHYYLSYFHLYIASAAILFSLLIGIRRCTVPTGLVALLMVLALLWPVASKFISIKGFFGKEISRLDSITEMTSPWIMIFEGSPAWLLDFYSLLFAFAPLVWLGSLVAITRTTRGHLVYFFSFALFGLSLAFLQLRMQYFGLVFFVLGPLLFARLVQEKFPRLQRISDALVAGVIAIAVSFPVSNRLFADLPIGLDAYYGLIYPAFPALQQACRQDPGVVLAYNDAGHYVRYHTNCSVIANNFLLTRQHDEKIRELDQLFSRSLPEILRNRPDIKYILVAFPKIFLTNEATGMPTVPPPNELMRLNERYPLMAELLFEENYKERGLRLLSERYISTDSERFPAVRLFKVKDPWELPTRQ